LLGVSPSAGGFVWKAVQEQADNLYSQLEEGADFHALAELHSIDVSAGQGGDMGFIHEGMTAKKVEDLLNVMKVGAFTKPVTLLDGISIFKLIGRKPAIVHPFEDVKQRATELALTAEKDKAWLTTKAKIKKNIKVEMNSQIFDE
jgi:parvulin-like peptidyl-prolyl isomerase